MVYMLIYICIRVSRDTYNRRGMSNMQLYDGRPGRMARGREVVVPPLGSDQGRRAGRGAGGTTRFTWDIFAESAG